MHFSKIIHHFPGHTPQQNKFVGTKYKLLIVIYLLFIKTSLNTSFGFLIRYWSTTSIPPYLFHEIDQLLSLHGCALYSFLRRRLASLRPPGNRFAGIPASEFPENLQIPGRAGNRRLPEPYRAERSLQDEKTYWRPFLLPAFRVRKGWRSESRFLLLHHQSG